MQYIKLLCSVLALCLMLTSNAYAATVDGDSPTANLQEDIPDWALRPALEPDEDPADEPAAGTVEDPASERGYTTIYNADGTLRYTDDPALLAGERPAALPAEADSSLFSKSLLRNIPSPRAVCCCSWSLASAGSSGRSSRGCFNGICCRRVFQITGVDAVPPANMAELIPYLLTVFIGIVLVVCVFRIVGTIAAALVNWRRF